MLRMSGEIVLSFFFVLVIHLSMASFVFHENTNVKFVAENNVTDNYFGYSTLMSPDGLFVGAPKAVNQFTREPNQTTGLIFFCSLRNLNPKQLVYCNQLQKGKRFYKNKMMNMKNQDLVEDSWFGSSLAFIDDKLLIAAPRLKTPSKYEDESLSRLQGGSYLVRRLRFSPLGPLSDDGKHRHQLYRLNGSRRNYGKNNTNTYYYSLGQFGFSMAVTKMNTMIFGVPGLLESAGGIISYAFNPKDKNMQTYLQPITNPYSTMDLDPDDNFGYSVESGTFTLNGSVFYVGGAPRAELARGKVLVIAADEPKYKDPTDDELESNKPLDTRVKLIGPQVGSYFGASLCCSDIDGDGRDDLLVGAPTFVKKDGSLPYDQGAVFIYMTKETESGFVLEPSGYVSGSRANGARFGTAIADLGDVDGDTFRDIAIGAPWEDNGVGAVYIYMGYEKGLKTDKVQRIQPPGARAFGWSITKGVDIDNNNCSDVVIGAYDSGAAYLYRCVPTMQVRASIRVAKDNKMNLPLNQTTFTAMFCVSSPPIASKVKLNMIGKIIADPVGNRSSVIGDSQYPISVTPGKEICNEKTLHVDVLADLTNPIILIFELEADELMKDNSTTFMLDAARLSDNSTLNISLPVQIMSDCGDDLLCSPWLNISLEALDNPYVPGSKKRFGIRLSARNVEEPAYGLKVNFSLPLHPKRIPSECIFRNLVMTCEMPQPFLRNAVFVWEVEMDYNFNTSRPINFTFLAVLIDNFRRTNISAKKRYQVIIDVTPEVNFSISGKALPNETMIIMRNNLALGANVSFQHLFAITNQGPSDWHEITAHIWIPDKAYITADIEGCKQNGSEYTCQWSIPAKTSYPVTIPLRIDLNLEGIYFKTHLMYNATSEIFIQRNQPTMQPMFIGYEVTTTFLVEPADLLWCIVVPCIILGLLLLAIIVQIMHKCGFFTRATRQKIKKFELNNQHIYRTIQTSDADQGSESNKDNQTENLKNEENSVVIVSTDMNRLFFHRTKHT